MTGIRSVDPADPRDAAMRRMEMRAIESTAVDKGRNRDFVQVYEKGWMRLQGLIIQNPTAARLWAFLAQHIDGTAGSVVVAQEVLAAELEVSERTVRRMSQALEDAGALTRIRVAGSVYAYCLNPDEVWRSWDAAKELAAFHTKTLVKKSDRANNQVRRKLQVMVQAQEGQAELPI